MISKKMKASILMGVMGLVFAGSAAASDVPESMHVDSVSLKQALEIAKSELKAEPIWADREEEMGQALYNIRLVTPQGKVFYSMVSALTGDVSLAYVKIEREPKEVLKNAAWLTGVNEGKLKTLVETIEDTEIAYDGRVYKIELDEDDGLFSNHLAYEMKLVNSNGKKKSAKVRVD